MARQKHSQVAQEIFQAFANGCANGSITDVQATMREVLGMAVEQMLKGELDAHLGDTANHPRERSRPRTVVTDTAARQLRLILEKQSLMCQEIVTVLLSLSFSGLIRPIYAVLIIKSIPYTEWA